jgi:hypothetical protein
MRLEDDALPLQPGVLEVEDQAYSQLGDAQIQVLFSSVSICVHLWLSSG